MPVLALWRRNWAVWAMPVSAVILVTMRSNQTDWFDGYPSWAAAQKAYSVVVLGIITALCGAAESGWLRRARLVERPSSRGFFPRFLAPILMTWLPTALLLFVGVVAAGGSAAVGVWVSSLVSLLAWTAVGFAVGIVVRPVIALPVSVILAFFWFGFTPSIEPPWIRHLAATWDGCCDVSVMPSVLALRGSLAMSCALIAASLLVVLAWVNGRRFRSFGAVGACVMVVVGLLTGYATTSQVGYFPTQPREDQVVCSAGQPEICLWPERAPYASQAAGRIHEITDRWKLLGIELPNRLSEGAVASPVAGIGPLIYSHDASPAEGADWLADGLVQSCSQTAIEASSGALGLFQAKDWLLHNSGVPDRQSQVSDPTGLGDLLALPASRQVELVNDYLRWARNC